VFQAVSATPGVDLYLVSTIEANATPQRLLQTRANESSGRVSPDGRWLAHVSDESGRNEIYVSRFPELQGKIAVSSGGARRPIWRADGKELFYLGEEGALMSVTIAAGAATLDVGKPSTLVRGGFYEGVYAPDASGTRFLIARRAETSETVPLEIVVNPFQQR
jgi:WD40-like Beta Propeller Repeat